MWVILICFVYLRITNILTLLFAFANNNLPFIPCEKFLYSTAWKNFYVVRYLSRKDNVFVSFPIKDKTDGSFHSLINRPSATV